MSSEAPAPARGWASHAWIVAALGFAVAFRGLLGFDGASVTPYSGADALFFSPSGSSPLLIYVLSAWLLFRRRERLRASFGGPPQLMIGCAMLGLAVALCAWSHYTRAHELLIPALSLALLGAAGLLGGREGLRAVRMPAAFLLLALPIPVVILNYVMHPMQLATAKITGGILSLLGLEVFVFGELVWYQDHIFHVIESCSGVRTLLTMAMASFLYIEIFPRPRARSLLLIGLSPLLALAVNQLRILSIIFNPYSDFAAVHDAQGVFMMALGVVLIALTDSALGRIMSGAAYRALSPSGPPHAAPARGQIVVAAAALGLAGFTLGVAHWEPPASEAKSVAKLAAQQGPWRERTRTQVDREFFGTVGFDRCTNRTYRDGEIEVALLLCSDRRLVHGNRMLSPKLRLPDAGWRIERSGRIPLRPDGPEVDFHVLWSHQGRRLVFFHRMGVASPAIETMRGVLALDRGPLHRPDRALVLRVGTALGQHDSFEDAAERLLRFLADFREPLAELGALPPGDGQP